MNRVNNFHLDITMKITEPDTFYLTYRLSSAFSLSLSPVLPSDLYPRNSPMYLTPNPISAMIINKGWFKVLLPASMCSWVA